MIKARTIQEMETLLEKAKAKNEKLNPVLEIIETGLYHVVGTKGTIYEIRAGRLPNRDLFIACQCRGALESKPCYHAAKVFQVHTAIKTLEIKRKDTDEQKKAPYFSNGMTKEKPVESIGKCRI